MKLPIGYGLLILTFMLAACSPGGQQGVGTQPPSASQASGAMRPLLTTSELVVGQNRFAFGLLQGDKLLEDSDVTVRVYQIDGQQAQLVTETKASYYPLEIIDQGNVVHIHPDGTRHTHDEQAATKGIYVAQVTFGRPGPWGIELLARGPDGTVDEARFAVNVLDAPMTPPLGGAAPLSRNLVAGDVPDLSQIDTSNPPDPRLHQVRIADAIMQGRPQVIVFATPKFCTSRVCGPVVDIVRTLLPVYGDRVAFIHQEIWQDFSSRQPFPTVKEWSLQTEPWIFVVDGKGTIRAKFEGLTTAREIDAALKQVLGAE